MFFKFPDTGGAISPRSSNLLPSLPPGISLPPPTFTFCSSFPFSFSLFIHSWGEVNLGSNHKFQKSRWWELTFQGAHSYKKVCLNALDYKLRWPEWCLACASFRQVKPALPNLVWSLSKFLWRACKHQSLPFPHRVVFSRNTPPTPTPLYRTR